MTNPLLHNKNTKVKINTFLIKTFHLSSFYNQLTTFRKSNEETLTQVDKRNPSL